MKKIILTLLAGALLFSCTTTPEGLGKAAPESMGMDPARLAQADSIINQAIKDTIIPGAVFAVVREDKIVYLKSYGYKSLVPEKVPMTDETIFDLASLSKCVGTTLSFMQLVEKGYVNIKDNVDRYIPGFEPWTDPQTGEKVDITVRDIMTHSSGLDAYPNVAECVSRFGENCPDSFLQVIAKETGRNFRPGTEFLYSCINFVTVQNILQNITGTRLCDYAQKNVFDALGLRSTFYIPTGTQLPDDMYDRIAPTEVQPDGSVLRAAVHDPLARQLNGGNSGNAGVFSDAEDLAVIAAAIMNGGEINGHRILSPAGVKLMSTVPPENDPAVGRALGWDSWSDHAGIRGNMMNHVLCHTGYTGTSMVIDLDSKTAVILLAHRVHPYDTGSLSRTRAMLANVVASSVLE